MDTSENQETSVISQKKGGQLYIYLNRPQQYNALNKSLLNDLYQALKKGENDPDVVVIFITTHNPKAFCSGADLSQINQEIESAQKTLEEQYGPVIKQIRTSKKPVIAGIMGAAVGAGMSIALSCDMIIATQNAYMASLFVRIGLIPDVGLSYYLTQLLGSKKSFELMSTGRNIEAEECLKLGLINEIVANDQLEKRLYEIGKFYEKAPKQAIAQIKNLVNQMEYPNLLQQFENEAIAQEKLMNSSDFNEGLDAFRNKRNPIFNQT